jgi:drug/metabolite transporter (DMT)-like permease
MGSGNMDSKSANASSTRAGDTNNGPRPAHFLLLALVPACFAFNPVSGRALSDALGPATLTFVRWSLSGLAIGIFALMRSGERWKAPPSHLLWLGILAAFGMGFCSVAAYVASRTTEATNIGLIYGCASAFVAAWEIIARRQAASASLLVGIAVCLLGAMLIITKGHPDAIASLRFNPGDLWATAGMLVFVGYTIAMRRVPARLTPMAQFAIMSLGASIAVLPFAATEIVASGFPAIDGRLAPWLAVVVFATGIGAYLGYNVSLTLNGPVLTAAALTLTPAFAAIEAMALIGEQLHWYHAVAILLVVAGLVLIGRGQRAR